MSEKSLKQMSQMMFKASIKTLLTTLALVAAMAIGTASVARAHCDTMSGPVITAALHALESGNANLVLIWVQPGDEAAVREALARALAARQAGASAQGAAEHDFFDTLVRIHRAGEGAPYTGLKPAGTDVGRAVSAADEALAAGSVEPVRAALVEEVRAGIERHFQEVMRLRDYDADDVAAGRAYVKAYVAFTHYAEGLYNQAASSDVGHEHEKAAHGSTHPAHPAH